MKKVLFAIFTIVLLAVSASALTLDTAEKTDEAATIDEKATLASNSIVLDEEKGVRIFLADFENSTDYKVVSYYNTDYMASASVNFTQTGWAVRQNDTVSSSNAVRIGRGDLSHTRAIMYFDTDNGGMEVKDGKYTATYDVRVVASTTSSDCTEFLDRIFETDSKYYSFNHNDTASLLAANAGKYQHVEHSFTAAPNNSGTKDVTFQGSSTNMTGVSLINNYSLYLKAKGNVYYDNLEMWHYPANSFMVKNGEALSLVTVTSDTYTFVETEGVSYWWLDGCIYEAGDSVAVSKLEYKTLVAVEEAFDEKTIVSNKGHLLYFHDFELGMESINYIDYNYIDGASLILNESSTVAEYAVDPEDENNYAIKLTNSKQSASGDNAQKIYRTVFTDTTEKVGKYTLEYKIMSSGEGTVGDMHNAKLNVGGTSGNYTEPTVKSHLSTTKGEWTNTLGTITVKEPSEGSYTVSVSGCHWVQNTAIENTYLGGFYAGGRGTVEALYIDDVKLYYYPAGSFILSNGTSSKLIEATGTKYTLPSAKDVFGTAVENQYGWADGNGTVYAIGEEVEVSALEYGTFTPVIAETPENAMNTEMRVTGAASTTGIRFSASIAPSLKAKADAYGFIIARADVLEKLGTELTFDITAEDVENPAKSLYAKGEAYNKETGKDIVYSANTDGTENYTGVCVGLTQKTRLR